MHCLGATGSHGVTQLESPKIDNNLYLKLLFLGGNFGARRRCWGGVERSFVSFFVFYAAVFFGSRVARCTQGASGANEEEDEKGRQGGRKEGREEQQLLPSIVACRRVSSFLMYIFFLSHSRSRFVFSLSFDSLLVQFFWEYLAHLLCSFAFASSASKDSSSLSLSLLLCYVTRNPAGFVVCLSFVRESGVSVVIFFALVYFEVGGS